MKCPKKLLVENGKFCQVNLFEEDPETYKSASGEPCIHFTQLDLPHCMGKWTKMHQNGIPVIITSSNQLFQDHSQKSSEGTMKNQSELDVPNLFFRWDSQQRNISTYSSRLIPLRVELPGSRFRLSDFVFGLFAKLCLFQWLGGSLWLADSEQNVTLNITPSIGVEMHLTPMKQSFI